MLRANIAVSRGDGDLAKDAMAHDIRMKNPAHPGGFVKTEIVEPLGLSVTDAAQALGITPAAFRMRAARARRRLRAAHHETTTKERTQWNATT